MPAGGRQTGRSAPALRSRNVLREAMEALPVAVMVLDGHRRVRYANAAARALGPRPLTMSEVHYMEFGTWARQAGEGAAGGALRALAKALTDLQQDPAAVCAGTPVRMATLRSGSGVSGYVVAVWLGELQGWSGQPALEAIARELDRASQGLSAAHEAIDAIHALTGDGTAPGDEAPTSDSSR
jgi:hypothetical protein